MYIHNIIKNIALLKQVEHLDSQQIETLISSIVTEGNEFISNFESNPPSEDSLNQYNNWINSAEGSAILMRLTNHVMTMIDTYPQTSVPGHDRRHIFKDLAASFHILNEEVSDDEVWKMMMVFPSLLHDSGRLVEELFRGRDKAGNDGGKSHAYLSYKMFQEVLLAFPEIPEALKNEMLYAIIVHQSARTKNRFMTWAVQRADREQLMGGELLSRIISADTGIGGVQLVTQFNEESLPVWYENLTLLPCLTLYEHRLYENLGAKGEIRANDLKAMAMACVQVASLGNGANLSNTTPIEKWGDDPFINWTNTGWNRSEVKDAVVPRISGILNQASQLLAYTPQISAKDFIVESVEHPNSHLPQEIKVRLKNFVDGLDPIGQTSLVRALLMMQHFRATVDDSDNSLLHSISNKQTYPEFIKSLATACRERMGKVTTPPILQNLGFTNLELA